MKRATGHGFLLSLLLNMAFRGFWLVLVAILVILHFAAGWPLWLIVIPLAAWVIHALLITLVLGFATGGPTTRKPEPENINPYSSKAYPRDPAGNHAGTFQHIRQDEAKKIMAGDEPYVIVDVRRPDEFAAGHIPGAINVPNESIAEEKPEALPDLDQLILVYCQSGRRSAAAAGKLAAMGYTHVKEFGGIMTWKGEVVRE